MCPKGLVSKRPARCSLGCMQGVLVEHPDESDLIEPVNMPDAEVAGDGASSVDDPLLEAVMWLCRHHGWIARKTLFEWHARRKGP